MNGYATEQRAFFVPIPHVVFDQILPTLKDTQVRVLFIVLRQTLGRSGAEPGGIKAADWLTHSQLRERTGRASEAVSSAVDVLVRRGLIEVVDAAGRAVATPAERRAHRGRLYYRPGRLIPLTPSQGTPSRDPQRETEMVKPKTTTNRNTQTCCRFRNIEGYGAPSLEQVGRQPCTVRNDDEGAAARIEYEKARIRERLANLMGR